MFFGHNGVYEYVFCPFLGYFSLSKYLIAVELKRVAFWDVTLCSWEGYSDVSADPAASITRVEVYQHITSQKKLFTITGVRT
jgi:hypothetical protein